MTWPPLHQHLYTCLMLLATFGTGAAAKGSLFSTSVMSMLPLLEMENELMHKLTSNAKTMQTEKLHQFNIYQQMLSHPPMHNIQIVEEYLGNPLNAFGLMRRLQHDWPKWLAYLTNAANKAQMLKLKNMLESVQDEKDLELAVKGLLRIETFYDLEALHMADGLLWNKQTNAHLTALDCVLLGDALFNRTEYTKSMPWYRNALRRYKSPYAQLYSRVLGLKRTKLYRKYAYAMVKEPPRDTTAEQYAKKVDPKWKNLANKVLHDAVAKANRSSLKKLVNEYLAGDERIFIEARATHKPRATYMQKGCRGNWPKREYQQLNCMLVYKGSAFLKVAPLKVEVVNLQPYIVLYHQMLYDSEIRELKHIGMNAKVNEIASLDSTNSVKQFKLNNEMHQPIATNLNHRIADMLAMDVGLIKEQPLHLLNYGLGGYLKRRSKLDKQKDKDERFATVLLYASNVVLGGETIFPKLKLVMKPQIGSALLWFHSHETAELNEQTEHAVCPVILGSRWTITKCMDAQKSNSMRSCLA